MSALNKKLREKIANLEDIVRKYRRIEKLIDDNSYGKLNNEETVVKIAQIVYTNGG